MTLRDQQHDLFRRGEYVALEVEGDRKEHVIAFIRRDAASGRSLLTVLPRFACTLMKGKLQWPLGDAWSNDRLRVPTGTTYRNTFTGESITVAEDGVRLSDIFATYPVALLLSE
jgi:(1->4)-alpha-D-glucan 1-alpha-D-glucosylmutase